MISFFIALILKSLVLADAGEAVFHLNTDHRFLFLDSHEYGASQGISCTPPRRSMVRILNAVSSVRLKC